MKIITLCVVFCFTSFLNLSAQWVQQSAPGTISFLNSINFTNANSGVTTGWGLDTMTTCRAYYTTNSGTTWIPASIPDSARAIVCSEFITSQIVYGTGGMNILSENFTDSFSKNFSIRNSNTNKACDASGGIEFSYGAFFQSTDGGKTWNKYGNVPQDCYYLTYSDFINANTGMAIASIGVQKGNTVADIIKTTNGGLSWNRLLSTNLAIDFKSICFVNDNLAFATGYQYSDTSVTGLVMKTTNGGMNWTTIMNDTNRYNKVFFMNNTTGFIAGNDYSGAIILKTTNEGNSWNIIHRQDSIIMEGINFYGESGVGIAYGEKFYTGDNYQPVVLRTNNFGQTWSVQKIQDNYPTISVMAGAMVDKYNYYLAGGTYLQGRIYNTKNGGSTSINNNTGSITSDYFLSQNFPNPFNPTTSIEFNLPVKSHITLKVYNGLGKEVIELMNEQKTEGRYEVKFDASNLPSGVYYYKLISDNFSDTKKMILVK